MRLLSRYWTARAPCPCPGVVVLVVVEVVVVVFPPGIKIDVIRMPEARTTATTIDAYTVVLMSVEYSFTAIVPFQVVSYDRYDSTFETPRSKD